MKSRDNRLRAYRFQNPESIPIAAGIPPLVWDYYDPEAIEDLLLGHPILFPGYERGSIYPDHIHIPPDMHHNESYTDAWGCVWKTCYTGMAGTVVHHPLADWRTFEGFSPPDPELSDGKYPLEWLLIENNAREARKSGQFLTFWLPHGHTLLRLMDLRGFENLMIDLMDQHPDLPRLLKMVGGFNLALVRRYLDLLPDMIGLPEDLGMQQSSLISPTLFRNYIKPIYCDLMKPILDRNVLIHQHCDGYILDLVDDLIDCGCHIINLQDLVNGIENIKKSLKGRVAIDLDIDRQKVTVTGNARNIDDLIREAVEKLGSPAGGLSLCYSPWPPTPIENIRAVFDAMEKYSAIRG